MKEEVKIDDKMIELGMKRRELILKVLGQLHRGQVGTLYFKNGCVFKVDYYVGFNEKEKRQFNPFGDFKGLRSELMKNIHEIAKKLNDEELSILEYLICEMEIDFDITNKKMIPVIKDDIQTIRERCANYLLIMAIEESEQ